MKISLVVLFTLIMLVYPGCSQNSTPATSDINTPTPGNNIKLPDPVLSGSMSLEEAIQNRRSQREYTGTALSLQEVSQIMWAGQGITGTEGQRTAPSAGGLYPLEIYLVAGMVDNLTAGIYKYVPVDHALTLLKPGDVRIELSAAALNQSWVRNGAAVVVVTAVYEHTTQKYGERGIRYVQMEAGHAAQNICLQVTASGLGAVTVGAFDDHDVITLLGLQKNETPLYLIPAGNIQ